MSHVVLDILRQSSDELEDELNALLANANINKAFHMMAEWMELEAAILKIRRWEETEEDIILNTKATDLLATKLRNKLPKLDTEKR